MAQQINRLSPLTGKKTRSAPDESAPREKRPVFMDVNIINPFLEAAMKVLGTMANVEARPGRPFIKPDNYARGDVSGIIGIKASDQRGTISVTFEGRCAMAVVGKMLMEELGDLNQDVADGVGEITNMISGQARRGLAEVGLSFEAGIPTVVVGRHHKIVHISTGPILAIPFKTDFGDLVVEVCFEQS